MGFFLGFSPIREIPDPARLKSAGIPWLRGEPRQCGLKAPGYVAFGWSRGSAGIVRIAWLRRPWLQQASAGHPWPACARSPHHRVFRHVEARGFVDAGSGMPRRNEDRHAAKDVAARGFRPSGTWMYRARVLEQDAEPRGGRNPLAAAAPPEELYSSRMAAHARLLSDLAVVDPCPPTQLGEEPQKSPLPGAFLCLAEREGFEPSIELLTLYSLSRGAPSASRASLRTTILL